MILEDLKQLAKSLDVPGGRGHREVVLRAIERLEELEAALEKVAFDSQFSSCGWCRASAITAGEALTNQHRGTGMIRDWSFETARRYRCSACGNPHFGLAACYACCSPNERYQDVENPCVECGSVALRSKPTQRNGND